MPSPTYVIVGAGLAGAKAAETLRERGFEGDVVLLGAEGHRPYERPDLSKHYLLGDKPRAELFVHDEAWYAEHDVELRTDTEVTQIERVERRLHLAGAEVLRYDRLLLATGAEPRRLPVPGADLDGVVTLRTIEDSDVLRERIPKASRVVVIGAGWIGCEIAAGARTLGAEVTMIAPDELPLVAVLGTELGTVYRDLHAEHGVQLRLRTGVEELVGSQTVEGVRTDAGDVVEADLVVVGIGASPRVHLAEAAGLVVDDGVLVDARLRTDDPSVFAAGDVARAWHPRFNRRIRVEHWANALNQGPAAAASMLGDDAPYDAQPYFYSDQYDLGMEYRGLANGADRVVLRGDVAGREFLAFWLKEGVVVAGMNVNLWDDGEAIEALLDSGRTVDPDRLADPDVPLGDV